MVSTDYRTLSRATELIKGPPSLLVDKVFTREETYPTETIELDELEALQLMLSESALDESAPVMSKLATRQTKTITPPVFKNKEPIKASTLFRRGLGQSPYIVSTQPAESAFENEVGRALALLKAAYKRRVEYLCAKAIQGTLSLTNVQIDYGVPSSHKFAGSNGDSWKAGRNPVDDIKAWQEKIGEDTGLAATVAICGTTVGKLLLNNTQVQNLLDIRYFTLGQVEFRPMGPARYLGRLIGVDIWEYYGGWEDANQTFTRMIPDDAFILIAPEAGFEVWHAAIPLIDRTTGEPTGRLFQGTVFTHLYAHPDPSVQQMFVEVASRPLPIIRIPKGLFIATNLNA